MGTNIDGVIPTNKVIEPMTGTVTPVVVLPPTTPTKKNVLDVLSRSAKTLVAVYAAFIAGGGMNILHISSATQLKITALATLITAMWNTGIKVFQALQTP